MKFINGLNLPFSVVFRVYEAEVFLENQSGVIYNLLGLEK